MKTKFGRKICMVTAAVLASTLTLSACGQKQKVGDADGELAPVELTYYLMGAGEPAAQPEVNEAISEYIKEKINATIKIEMFDYNSYDSKINSMIAGGEPFDLMFSPAGSVNYATAARKGSFMPISDLMDKYGQGIKETLGDFFLEAVTVDGEIYALPTNKEKAHNYGFLLRKDLVEKYNVDISTIHSLADLEPYLEIIKQNEPKVYPLMAAPKQNWWLLTGIEGLSGSDYVPGAINLNDDETQIVNQYETEEYMEQAKLIRRYYQAGYIRQDAATNIASGEDGLYFAKFGQLKPGAAEAVSNDNLAWVQVDITEPVASTRDGINALAAFSATSKNPERAMMFMNLLYTDKTLIDMLYYGIEGKHYTRIDENTVQTIDDSGYNNLGNRWRYGNQMLASLTTKENPEYWLNIEAFNQSARPLKSLGFSFDPNTVKTEMGACENAYAEFAPLINVGAVDPETAVPQLVDKLKEAGSDKIIEELTRQYKEFLANKK